MIHVTDDSRALHVQKDKGGHHIAIQRRESSGCRSWIDEKFRVEFVCFESMGVSSDENIDIKLSLKHSFGFFVAPWNHLMTMTHSNFELSNCDHLHFGESGVLIKISTNKMNVGCKSPQIIVNSLCAKVFFLIHKWFWFL